MLSLSLPQNVHLLTFEPWKDETILMRFEHILEKNEDIEYASPVTFNFNDVFHSFNIYELRETTLAANQWLSEAKRFKFTPQSSNETQINPEINADNSANLTSDAINLQPSPSPEISESRQKRKRNRHNFARSSASDDDDDYTITLKPMQIRTFVVTLEWKP